MIRGLFFLAGFFLGFSLEVRVQANERVQLRGITLEAYRKSHQDSRVLLEEPKACLDDKDASARTCAVQVGKKQKLTVEFGHGAELTLGGDTLLIRKAATEFRLLSGVVRARGENLKFETEFGNITTNGEVFLDKGAKQIVMVNTGEGYVLIKGRGWSEEQSLGPGYEVELARPSAGDGKASVTMPFPLNYDQQVVREARFFEGKKEEFPKRLAELIELRMAVQEEAAKFHQEKAERKIASIEEEKRRKAEIRRIREAKDREIRALFRKRVLEVE